MLLVRLSGQTAMCPFVTARRLCQYDRFVTWGPFGNVSLLLPGLRTNRVVIRDHIDGRNVYYNQDVVIGYVALRAFECDV